MGPQPRYAGRTRPPLLGAGALREGPFGAKCKERGEPPEQRSSSPMRPRPSRRGVSAHLSPQVFLVHLNWSRRIARSGQGGVVGASIVVGYLRHSTRHPLQARNPRYGGRQVVLVQYLDLPVGPEG